jgi:hypothetical protein
MGDAKGVAQYASDAPDKPYVSMRLWQNPQPMQSSLSASDQQRLDDLQQRTLAGQARARAVAEIISGIPASQKQQSRQTYQARKP